MFAKVTDGIGHLTGLDLKGAFGLCFSQDSLGLLVADEGLRRQGKQPANETIGCLGQLGFRREP